MRYTFPPCTQYGAGPVPTAVVASPIKLSGPQSPWEAAGSGHCTTLFRIPESPAGVVTLTPDRSGSLSWREKLTLNPVNAAACETAVPAVNAGLNGCVAGQEPPPAASETPNVAVGVEGAPDWGADHGVNVEVVV